jgi:hypothetical protein
MLFKGISRLERSVTVAVVVVGWRFEMGMERKGYVDEVKILKSKVSRV